MQTTARSLRARRTLRASLRAPVLQLAVSIFVRSLALLLARPQYESL